MSNLPTAITETNKTASTPTRLSASTWTLTPVLETNEGNFIRIENHYEDNTLTWIECEVPQEDYHNWLIATDCLGLEFPTWTEIDKQRLGERFQTSPGNLEDIRLTVGQDIYETQHQGSKYKLSKNGEVIVSANSVFSSFDPNRSLLNVDGKIVWELTGLNFDQTELDAVVFFDGINLQDQYDLEGAYIPYVLNNSLIFIAEKNGMFFVMSDQKQVGPVFSDISIGYCCEPAAYSIQRTGNQYWFWGMREDKYYVVALYGE